jgi:hypothetical protein
MNFRLLTFVTATWAAVPSARATEIEMKTHEIAPAIRSLAPGKSSFRDAIRLFGAVKEVGGNGESPTLRLCYRAEEPRDETALVFESSALGGYGEFISAYRVMAQPPIGLEGKCRPSPLVKRTIALPNGVQLGLSCDAAARKLGKGVSIFLSGAEVVETFTRRLTTSETKALGAALNGPTPSSTEVHRTEGTRLRCTEGLVTEIEVFRWDER